MRVGFSLPDRRVFFRRLPATQIIRDAAVIESGITIPLDLSEDGGIGFGSLLSTEDDVDTLCWTGNDRRECVEIGGTTSDGGGDIIEIQADQPDPDSECADAEELFGQDLGTFDYLARFFTDRFGLDNAVLVVTCDGVSAESLTLTGTTIHEGVVVTATRSMSAYDRIRFGGGYCC